MPTLQITTLLKIHNNALHLVTYHVNFLDKDTRAWRGPGTSSKPKTYREQSQDSTQDPLTQKLKLMASGYEWNEDKLPQKDAMPEESGTHFFNLEDSLQ